MKPQTMALVVANGEPPSLQCLQHLYAHCNFCIGVDGGAQTLLDHRYVPDWIIGDLDSFQHELPSESQIIPVSDPNTNDLDKAICYGIQQGVHAFHVCGASGRRQDHFVANLEVLYKYHTQAQIYFWTEDECLFVIQNQWKAKLEVEQRLSLFPLFGTATGVQTQGLKYEISGSAMQWGVPPCGLSNEVIAPNVIIHMESGCLLVTLGIPSRFKSIGSFFPIEHGGVQHWIQSNA